MTETLEVNPYILTISYWYNNSDYRYFKLENSEEWPLISYSTRTEDLSLISDENIQLWIHNEINKKYADFGFYYDNLTKTNSRKDDGLGWFFNIYQDGENDNKPIGRGSIDCVLLQKLPAFY